jgi:hypothetical protein
MTATKANIQQLLLSNGSANKHKCNNFVETTGYNNGSNLSTVTHTCESIAVSVAKQGQQNKQIYNSFCYVKDLPTD